MKYFLYLQFGKEVFRKELSVSIASLLKTLEGYNDYKVVVLTDCPKQLEMSLCVSLDSIIIHTITEDMLNEWTNHGRYYYSAKAKALKWFFDTYQSDVIFLDTDTIINKNMSELYQHLNENFIMDFKCRGIADVLNMVKNAQEEISDETVKKRHQQRLDCFRLLYNGVTYSKYSYQYDIEHSLYNSGVIGISYQNKDILDEVIELINHLYSNTNYGAAEEVAFSIVFQKYAKVKTVDEYVVHYYECKDTRLIAAALLDILDNDDCLKLESLLKGYGIETMNDYDIALSESNAFMDYIRFCKGNVQPYYGNKFEGQCYTSEEKIAAWEKLNRRCFKKWIRSEEKLKEK